MRRAVGDEVRTEMSGEGSCMDFCAEQSEQPGEGCKQGCDMI